MITFTSVCSTNTQYVNHLHSLITTNSLLLQQAYHKYQRQYVVMCVDVD